MRVLVNLLHCHREFTGTGRYIRNMLVNLAKLDHENEYVLILSSQNEIAYAIDQSNFKILRVTQDVSWRVKRIAFEQLSLPLELKQFAGPQTVFWSPNDAPSLFWSGKQVITIHDLRRVLRPKEFGVVERVYYRAMLRASVHKAARLLTVSETSKDDICRYFGVPQSLVSVAPNAVAETLRPATSDEIDQTLIRHGIKRPFVLFVGSQLLVKSPHTLVDAFALVARTRPDLHLVLIGKPGNATPSIDKLIREHQLRNVSRIAWVPDEDLRAAMSSADVFVFPTQYEGFGIPPLEAMACGTPVITSKLSCMPEVCGDGALYSDVTPVGLASAIEHVLGDRALRERLVTAGHRNVQRFSWDRSARTILEVLRQTASS